MAAARCSICGIDYPAGTRCQVAGCGETLAHFDTVEPHSDWRERVEAMSTLLEEARAERSVDELREYRVVRFMSIGFPEYAAELLADARDAPGFPLWWGRVDDVLKRGASHALALRIFA